FAQATLDEALGLAVCSRRVRLGPDVPKAEALAGSSEGEGFVAGAVVRHHAFDLDAEARVIGERGLEEDCGAALPLTAHDLGEGDAGVIVDGDMDELPSGPFVAAALPIAGGPVAGAREAAELLDIEVDHLSGLLALVAAHRRGRLQRADPVETQSLEDTANRGRRNAKLGGDLLAGAPRPAQRLYLLDHRLRRWPVQPMGPRAAVAQTDQAFTMISLNPLADGPRADACGFADGLQRLPARDLPDDPLSTNRRQPGILMDVHPVPRER